MRWRRWIFADWRLKLAGVAGAAVLWYWTSGRTVELTVGAPVVLSAESGDLVLASSMPHEVQVRFSVRRSLVRDLESGTVRVVAGLGKSRKRRQVVELGPDNVVCPAGAMVLDVKPALVIVEVETRVQGRE